jgi:tetratricopeptide (TPR) repeat protein
MADSDKKGDGGMTREALLKQLELWHEDGGHQQIVDEIFALPERDYLLTSLLARALNNLSRCMEALELLESVRTQGESDALWHFRVGYSLFYLDREQESIPYFERAIELGDDHPGAYELLLWARKCVKGENDEDKDSEDNEDDEYTVVADFISEVHASLSLNMRLQPHHRAEWFEEGLDFMLRSKSLGCVSGGGTAVSSDGEPESCDIEIDLAEDSEEARQMILAIAQKLGVAKGSRLIYHSAGKETAAYSIGNLEGLAVYLEGTDLPDEVYENNDVNDVVGKLLGILKSNGALVWSYCNGPTGTALYFYGEGGYELMLEKVTPFLKEHPLCQKCKTVKIA